ncbi:hypothetical protein CDL60_00535 [Roseateles noduli]|nr:hypothetical protein CDL60_00535 [Roseateles noduli]
MIMDAQFELLMAGQSHTGAPSATRAAVLHLGLKDWQQDFIHAVLAAGDHRAILQSAVGRLLALVRFDVKAPFPRSSLRLSDGEVIFRDAPASLDPLDAGTSVSGVQSGSRAPTNAIEPTLGAARQRRLMLAPPELASRLRTGNRR